VWYSLLSSFTVDENVDLTAATTDTATPLTMLRSFKKCKIAKSSSSSSPLKNSQKFTKIRLIINYLDINFDFLMNSLDAIIITLLDK
jgi:hypothetical protein